MDGALRGWHKARTTTPITMRYVSFPLIIDTIYCWIFNHVRVVTWKQIRNVAAFSCARACLEPCAGINLEWYSFDTWNGYLQGVLYFFCLISLYLRDTASAIFHTIVPYFWRLCLSEFIFHETSLKMYLHLQIACSLCKWWGTPPSQSCFGSDMTLIF